MTRFLLVLLISIAFPTIAADFQSFGRDSRLAIEKAHAKKAFVLAFWSVDCLYCGEEIRHLDHLVREHPGIALVLVCTDGVDMASQANHVLDHDIGIKHAERWIFSDSDADRLYFAVDKKWRGELPRAYFYDTAGNTQMVAGQVDLVWLRAWASKPSVQGQ
jgi:hypothetical protein